MSCISGNDMVPEDFCPFKFMKSIPRLDGHCYSFHIPTSIWSSDILTEEAFATALVYLNKIESLRWGDLVIFDIIHDGTNNDGIVIFNGCTLLNLDYTHCSSGALPSAFKVGFVPFNYWYHIDCSRTGHGILHTSLVWYDYPSDLMIQNIRYEKQNNLYILYTYNDNIIIVYDNGENPLNRLDYIDLCTHIVNFSTSLQRNSPLFSTSETFSDLLHDSKILYLID